MNIPAAQIEFRKRVGKAKGKDLWHIKTKGGLHVIADYLGKVVGSGPHRAVARHITERYEPDATWTELSKSDHYDVQDFQHLLPEYEALTEKLRKMQDE